MGNGQDGTRDRGGSQTKRAGSMAGSATMQVVLLKIVLELWIGFGVAGLRF